MATAVVAAPRAVVAAAVVLLQIRLQQHGTQRDWVMTSLSILIKIAIAILIKIGWAVSSGTGYRPDQCCTALD